MRQRFLPSMSGVLLSAWLAASPAHGQAPSHPEFSFAPPAGWTLKEAADTKNGGKRWRYQHTEPALSFTLRLSLGKGRTLAQVTDQFLERAKKKDGHRILSASRMTTEGKTVQFAMASHRLDGKRAVEARVIVPLRSGDFLHAVVSAPRAAREAFKAALKPIIDAITVR